MTSKLKNAFLVLKSLLDSMWPEMNLIELEIMLIHFFFRKTLKTLSNYYPNSGLLNFLGLPPGCQYFTGLQPQLCYVNMWRRIGCLDEGAGSSFNFDTAMNTTLSALNI